MLEGGDTMEGNVEEPNYMLNTDLTYSLKEKKQ
jgi:hypothetical protein